MNSKSEKNLRNCFIPNEEIQNSSVGPNWASTVVFGTVVLNNKRYPVLSKVKPDSDEYRSLMGSDIQFMNELRMYEVILPKLKVDDLFPKFYFGRAVGGDEWNQDIIMLEDLTKSDYKVSDEKVFLDLEHILLAVRGLGNFHASSYREKGIDKENFLDNAKKLKVRPIGDEKSKTEFQVNIRNAMLRGINPLINENKELLTKLISLLNDMDKLNQFIYDESNDKVNVVCHGDFCRNNMFFRYNKNKKPESVKFFDLQNSVYGSPAIDLSFFLFLNTDRKLRESHWKDIINCYRDSVRNAVPIEIDVPTEEEFNQDLAERAIHGYFHCSFFLPVMVSENQLTIESYNQLDEAEKAEMMFNNGGEEATQLIVDLVRHMIDHGYIEKFIETFQTYSS